MVDMPRTSRLFGWAVDTAPGVVFLMTYLVTRDFRLSTLSLVAAAALALTASAIVERRLRPLPTVTGALAVVFGGASLLLRNPEILKMKMTIVDGLLGAALLFGVALKKNPLKMILGATFSLPDKACARANTTPAARATPRNSTQVCSLWVLRTTSLAAAHAHQNRP